MNIRTATLNDLDAVTAVEAACFPAAEAASKKEFAERLRYYGNVLTPKIICQQPCSL